MWFFILFFSPYWCEIYTWCFKNSIICCHYMHWSNHSKTCELSRQQSSKWKFEFTGPNQILEFILHIYIYIYLNKNWKIYWSEWSFTCLGQGDWCSSWGLGNFLLITILHDVKQMHTCTVYRVRVWLGVWKESLNCDGPQFHKTNNHLSPHLKHKNPQHITLEIHVLSWERHKNVEGLNLIMGLQSTLSSWSLDNWISNISICIFTNDKKNLHRFTTTQKDHKKSLYNQPKPYFFKKNIVKSFLDRF